MSGQPNELTAAQVEQAGRLLMPHFREAVRAEVAPLDKRVKRVERIQTKVIAIYGVGAAGVTAVWSLCGNWILSFAKTKAKELVGL